MGLVAVSLSIRTLIYAIGVWLLGDRRLADRLGAGLAGAGRGVRDRAWSGPATSGSTACPGRCWGGRFLRVFLRRGRSVCLIQVSQTVIGSADFMVVGLMSQWADVGRYGAPHRMITAVLTFGLIFQQVVFPDAGAVVAEDGGLGTPGAERPGPGPGRGPDPGGRRRHHPGRAARPVPAREIRRRQPPARPGHLAGAPAEPGLPLPDDPDRPEPRGGRRPPARWPGRSGRGRWSRSSAGTSAWRGPRRRSCSSRSAWWSPDMAASPARGGNRPGITTWRSRWSPRWP